MSGIEGSAIPIIESDHKDKLTEKKKEQLKIQPKKFLESVGWSILFVLIYTLIGFSLLTIKFGDKYMWQTDGAALFKTLRNDKLNEYNVLGVNWWNNFILGGKAIDGYEDVNDYGLAGGIGSWNNFHHIYQQIKLAANNWEKSLLTLGNGNDDNNSTNSNSNSSQSGGTIGEGIGNLIGTLLLKENVSVLTFLFSPIILALLLIATPLIAFVMPIKIMGEYVVKKFVWSDWTTWGAAVGLLFAPIMAAFYTLLSTKDLIVKIFFYTFGCFFNGDIKSSTFKDLDNKLMFFESTRGVGKNIEYLANTILAIFLLLILISAYYYINATFASGGFTIYLIWLISINFSGQFEELGKKFSGMFSSQKKK